MITTIEVAIEDKLKSTTPITDIVGQKIYANIADQAAEQESDPYIVIITDEQEDEQTSDGVGISFMTIYTDIYHEDLRIAISIQDEIKTALQEYEGTHDDVYIQEMWQTNKTMARDDQVGKHVYRMEWAARVNIS